MEMFLEIAREWFDLFADEILIAMTLGVAVIIEAVKYSRASKEEAKENKKDGKG